MLSCPSMEVGLASVTAAALARHERYVREFVEGFNFCPYARRSRETGTLQRVVLLEESFPAAASAIADAIERLEQLPAASVEVAFIILPSLELESAREFEMLVRAAREQTEARHGSSATPFYCVAFHPDFAEDLVDEHRAVRFLRRSPDPTVQLVRASVLEKVRASNATPSVSDRIAAANLQTLKDEGADAMRALLGVIRANG
ncbi:MAG TPA: DUF1415 family protein [Burkholderiales bacterium]|nr:DUF1415 family protein [Burkholderiales bacterium]